MRPPPCSILAFLLVGCGSPPAEPVLGGTVTGSYDGTEFTAENGFATADEDSALIILGNGNLYCGSDEASDPPTGHDAAIFLPALEVGTYGSVLVQMIENLGSYESHGANVGSVVLTEVTETSVSGEVAFTYQSDDGGDFSLSGTFEVTRCSP
jgi:hypothetical protein